MKRSVFWVSLCVVASGVAAIALGQALAGSARPSTEADQVAKSDRYACFDPRFTYGFQTINDHKLIITSDRDEPYEVTVAGICMGLDSTFALGIQPRHGAMEVCGPFDADIVYRDMGELRTCRISTVRHLTGDEAAPYKRTRKPAAAAAASR